MQKGWKHPTPHLQNKPLPNLSSAAHPHLCFPRNKKPLFLFLHHQEVPSIHPLRLSNCYNILSFFCSISHSYSQYIFSRIPGWRCSISHSFSTEVNCNDRRRIVCGCSNNICCISSRYCIG